MENMGVPEVDVKAEVKVDLTPAVKAGSGIATNTHKGVSKIVYALCGPWMEGRIRKAELIAAQTSKDCADIKNGLVTYTGENVIPFEPQTTVASSFEALHKLNHASDAKRLHAAMQEAARQISEVPEEQVSDEPLSQDFFNHWRREAEMIDDEEVRKWWAGLLVEETKVPTSISPRTLDVARNLSRNEAQVFQKLLKGLIAGILPVDAKGVPQYISYVETLLMQDAGLIVTSESEMTWTAVATNSGVRSIVAPIENSDFVLCSDGEELKVDCYLLTVAGLQLSRMICPKRSVNDAEEIAKHLCKLYNGHVFSIHEKISEEDGRATWKILPLWISDVRKLPDLPAQGVAK